MLPKVHRQGDAVKFGQPYQDADPTASKSHRAQEVGNEVDTERVHEPPVHGADDHQNQRNPTDHAPLRRAVLG